MMTPQQYDSEYNAMAQQQQLMMQQARTTQLPNYVVSGAVNAPSGGVQAPPQGVVMQFPGGQDAADNASIEPGEEDAEQELTAEEKAAKAEKEKQQMLERAIKRTRKNVIRAKIDMNGLRRWIKKQTKALIVSVTVLPLSDSPPSPSPLPLSTSSPSPLSPFHFPSPSLAHFSAPPPPTPHSPPHPHYQDLKRLLFPPALTSHSLRCTLTPPPPLPPRRLRPATWRSASPRCPSLQGRLDRGGRRAGRERMGSTACMESRALRVPTASPGRLE